MAISTIPVDVIDRFRTVAGADGWSDDPARLAPHLTDWRGQKTGTSPLLLLPRDCSTLAAIVRLANETGTPLVPQGGNTGLVGGGTPEADGRAVLVSMLRMNRIRSLSAEDFSIVAEAGVVLETLHTAAAAADRLFPLSLGAKGSATIGGLVSTNAGGTQVLRHGPMRAQVLGLEAVLPDGTLLNQLTPLRKDNTGYDIKQLLIGAEGTLGFVTAASLRLLPAPREVATGFVAVTDPQAALELLAHLKAATGDNLDSFELLPRAALELVVRHIPGARDPLATPAPWYILVEATSAAPGDAMRRGLEAGLLAAHDADLISDAAIAETTAQAADFWRLRDTIAEAERIDGPSVKHDVAVPVADMPRFMTEATRVIEAEWAVLGACVFAFGHLGDGNVHFNVKTTTPGPRPELMAARHAISDRVYDIVASFGGSISAEHGIGTSKAATLARLGDPAKLAAMRVIKAALDPNGIMNPGKLLS
jgi:FAD/FMN-containing dehydrogenase